MDTTPLKSALEAVLFASGDPVPTARLSLVFGIPEEDVKSAAAELAAEYEANKRGVRLLFLGKTLQLCSASEHAKLISRVIEHRAAPRLSPGALEALAIVAYFQPVTRAYVEQVRGGGQLVYRVQPRREGAYRALRPLEAPAGPRSTARRRPSSG